MTISIHALRVEGDKFFVAAVKLIVISIHALRVEGDNTLGGKYKVPTAFLSTPSGWRATGDKNQRFVKSDISIHALRVEGDLWSC